MIIVRLKSKNWVSFLFKAEMEQWESWGVETNSNSNRNSSLETFQQTHEEEINNEEVDFFTDMTPQYKKAAKVIMLPFSDQVQEMATLAVFFQIVVKKKEQEPQPPSGLSSRLGVQSAVPMSAVILQNLTYHLLIHFLS